MPARWTRCCCWRRLPTSIGYAGRGDFTMAADGRLTRRAERDVAPFVYAGAAILRPELFKGAPDGRLLAHHAVRSRRRNRPAARAAARRHLDACRHAGGDRARPRQRSRRAWDSLIPSSAYLWRPCIAASPGRAGDDTMRAPWPSVRMAQSPRLHDPGVGAVPADADRGVAARQARARLPAGRDPLALASATIYLPTRRACRLAQKIFLEVLNSDAAILPRIVPVGDVDEDELAFARGGERRESPTPRWSFPRRSMDSAASCRSRR